MSYFHHIIDRLTFYESELIKHRDDFKRSNFLKSGLRFWKQEFIKYSN